jgi:hypothetical protein
LSKPKAGIAALKVDIESLRRGMTIGLRSMIVLAVGVITGWCRGSRMMLEEPDDAPHPPSHRALAAERPRAPCVFHRYHTEGSRQVAKAANDYWASATMPHGRNCGGLDIGCRKKACSCPFSTPLPTI